MCLPNFIKFEQIEKENALTGFRSWKNLIKDNLELKSEYQNYIWKKLEGPHEVTESNSGIYSYNYNYNYYYNYYNNYNYNYYNYNYYNNYNYYLSGIIKQWGKVAIHNEGYRSEFAIVDTLFTIRESDAEGSKEFLDWIKVFNSRIEQIAQKYNSKTIHWQDYKG